MTIDYQELSGYLQSQKINISVQDIMTIERLCLEQKLETSERLVAYAAAAWKQFNIPPEQAIDLAAKSLNLTLRTFMDTLIKEGLKEWTPIIKQAASSLRSELMAIFHQELMNPTITETERGVFSIQDYQLMERYQSAQMRASESYKPKCLTLQETLTEIGETLNIPQLPN